MAKYELGQDAADDLETIADYTISNWGAKQASRYSARLDSHFDAIANGKARSRHFLPHRPELLVSHIEHHFVFHLERKNDCPLIIAVFHEKMDLMARLRERLL